MYNTDVYTTVVCKILMCPPEEVYTHVSNHYRFNLKSIASPLGHIICAQFVISPSKLNARLKFKQTSIDKTNVYVIP